MTMIRQFARSARWTPQRLLHPLRRARTLRALRRRRPPRTILVVCHGNICRSPFAQELILERLPPEDQLKIRVLSAGFIGANRPSPPEALATALRWGVDLSGHRSRELSAEGVRDADLILVMDELQQRALCRRFRRAEEDVRILGDLDPEPIDRRTIRDPVEQPEEVFLESYARIERCVGALVTTLVESPGKGGGAAVGGPVDGAEEGRGVGALEGAASTG